MIDDVGQPRHTNPHAPAQAVRRSLLTAWLASAVLVTSGPGPALARADPPRAASPDAVAQIDIFPAAGVYSLWLDNGVRVHIRPMRGPDAAEKSPASSQGSARAASSSTGDSTTPAVRSAPAAGKVCVTLTIVGGEILEGPRERGLTRAAGTAWARPVPSPSDTALELYRNASPEGLTIRIACSADHLDDALALAARMLADPQIDPERLSAWKGQAAKQMERRARQPEALIAEAAMHVLLPPDRRARGADTPEEIDAITPERAAAWLRDRTRLGPVEVGIAGDVAASRAIDLAGRSLGGTGDAARTLPGVAPRPRVSPSSLLAQRDLRSAGRADPHQRLAIDLPLSAPSGGPVPAARLIVGLHAPDLSDITRSRRFAVAVDIAALRARSALEARGLRVLAADSTSVLGRMYVGTSAAFVYADVAQLAPRPTPAQGPSAPAKLPDEDGALAAMRAALDALAAEGPSAGELDRAVKERLNEVSARFATPDYWATVLSYCTLHGLSPDTLAGALDDIRALTCDSVRREFATWWTPAGTGTFEIVGTLPR